MHPRAHDDHLALLRGQRAQVRAQVVGDDEEVAAVASQRLADLLPAQVTVRLRPLLQASEIQLEICSVVASGNERTRRGRGLQRRSPVYV